MLRTINYTGRKKITQQEISITMDEVGGKKTFDIEFRILEGSFPDHASLYVEAYFKETRQRFSFGTIGKICPPESRIIDKVDFSGETLFKVLVVDESNSTGVLLGVGKELRAGNIDYVDRESLISVESRDLGNELWNLQFDESRRPVIYLNRSIPNVIGRLSEDITFQALVLPEAFRRVLMYCVSESDDFDDDSLERWKEFAKRHSDRFPNEDESDEEKSEWIEEVVSSFCNSFRFCERFISENYEK
ncbi:hypothetical protein KIH87_04545 [Paraneptunicella aestuarii]|uniref:hypothetical protein n=1 Tax=Paraneptunicella aestuarii TaxID=2831148 RepID=UPI001E2D7F3C|nr:hypothetical protein [Paraneptunicella aestuarii]UAA39631.1 hypothetical protein KIH87_04545 [Paraneptunicella aestuarii]